MLSINLNLAILILLCGNGTTNRITFFITKGNLVIEVISTTLRLCGFCLLLLALGGTLLLIIIDSGTVVNISHALKLVLACGRNIIRVAIPRHLHSTIAIIGYYLGRTLLTETVGKVVCVTDIEGKNTVDVV